MKSHNGILKVLLLIILVAYSFLYLSSLDIIQNKNFSFLVIILNILTLFIFSQYVEPIIELKKQYIRIVTIFLLGYVIVFFQLHVDYLLDNFDESNTRFWVNPNIVPKALMLSSIGLVAFLFGYLIRIRKVKKTKANIKYKYRTSVIGYSFLAMFFLIVMMITINPLYLYGGYGLFEMGEIARYSSILFELSFTAGLIQHIINIYLSPFKKYNIYGYYKKLGFFHLLLLLLYAIIIIISGDRGPIIYLGIGLLSSYIISVKWKVPRIKVVLFFIIGTLLVSSLVAIRNNQDSNNSTLERVYNALVSGEFVAYSSLGGTKSISVSTLELATSLRTLHNAVDQVPNNSSFFYGQFQVLQIITVVPFGQGVIKNIFNLKDNELTSAKYVTALVGGENGSEGTSCIADLYLDFGVFGVFIGMLFFGIFVRLLEENVFTVKIPNLLYLISYMIICQYAIYIPRSTIMFNFRNILWVMIIMKFIQLISKKYKVNEINN